MVAQTAKLNIEDLKVSYGDKQVIHGISFDIQPNEIFGVIGPSQSGKTSMLRVINRTIEFTANARVEGTVKMDGQNAYHVKDVYEYRRRIGMVAPLPVGLPLTIYDNVAFAPRSFGMKGKSELDELVTRCLEQAALWDEVKDRLNTLGTMLSGGQQQRLTIARALSHQPEVLCLDEFSIAIDPVTTMKIEDVRAKNDGELESELMALKKEQLNLRFQRATGQLENTARVRSVRRDIARIKTILNQRTRPSS